MAISTSPTNGETLSIDRLCEAVNSIDQNSKAVVFTALQETFPEIIWTHNHDGRISAAVH